MHFKLITLIKMNKKELKLQEAVPAAGLRLQTPGSVPTVDGRLISVGPSAAINATVNSHRETTRPAERNDLLLVTGVFRCRPGTRC